MRDRCRRRIESHRKLIRVHIPVLPDGCREVAEVEERDNLRVRGRWATQGLPFVVVHDRPKYNTEVSLRLPPPLHATLGFIRIRIAGDLMKGEERVHQPFLVSLATVARAKHDEDRA